MSSADAMPATRLVLFDIDGTLLSPRGVGRASTRAAMLEVFGTCGALDSHAFAGKTDWFTLVEVLSRDGYTEADIGRIMPVYEESVARHLARIIGDFPVEACPGALETVRQLRRQPGLFMGIVTGNVSTTAPIKLRAAGFDPAWFPIGAYGSDAMDRNALPGIALERAIHHYRRPFTPEQVIVVGDTPADVECAREVGAAAVAVKTGFGPLEELMTVKPDYLLDDLTGLLDVIQTTSEQPD